jgi:hypothetical protein
MDVVFYREEAAASIEPVKARRSDFFLIVFLAFPFFLSTPTMLERKRKMRWLVALLAKAI